MQRRSTYFKEKPYSAISQVLIIVIFAVLGIAVIGSTVGVAVGLVFTAETTTALPPIVTTTVTTTTINPNASGIISQAYLEQIVLTVDDQFNSILVNDISSAICHTLTLRRIIDDVSWENGPLYISVHNQSSENSSIWFASLYYNNDSCNNAATCVPLRNAFLKAMFASPIRVSISAIDGVHDGIIKLPEFLSTTGRNISDAEFNRILMEEMQCSSIPLVYSGTMHLLSSNSTQAIDRNMLSRTICQLLSTFSIEQDNPFYIEVESITAMNVAAVNIFYKPLNCYTPCLLMRNNSISSNFTNLSLSYLTNPNNPNTKILVTILSATLNDRGMFVPEDDFNRVSKMSQQCTQNYMRYETIISCLPLGSNISVVNEMIFNAITQIHMNIVNWTYGPFLIELISDGIYDDGAYIYYDKIDCSNTDCKANREKFLMTYLTNISQIYDADLVLDMPVSVGPALFNDMILTDAEGEMALARADSFPPFVTVYEGLMTLRFFNAEEADLVDLQLQLINDGVCNAVSMFMQEMDSPFSSVVLNQTSDLVWMVRLYYNSSKCEPSLCKEQRKVFLDIEFSFYDFVFQTTDGQEVQARAQYDLNFDRGMVVENFVDQC